MRRVNVHGNERLLLIDTNVISELTRPNPDPRVVSFLHETDEDRLFVSVITLGDPIDTSTPQGMFTLQVLGAIAQLERALISERTKTGIKAARARGKLPSNHGLRSKQGSRSHSQGWSGA